MDMKTAFPYFGGKSHIAPEVWQRFGDVKNYVEPFCGGCGMLLCRPDWKGKTETINDKYCFVANFWRAAKYAPAEEMAELCDWPINETDLYARHVWLKQQSPKLKEGLEADPHWYDPQIAAYWVWGQSCWIGQGWCHEKWTASRQRPGLSDPNGSGTTAVANGAKRKRPQLDSAPRGVLRNGASNGTPRQKPLLGDNSCGVHRGATGHAEPMENLLGYFTELKTRLRRVRVCCGDWKRVLTKSVTTRIGTTAVFLDPPYLFSSGRDKSIYAEDDGEVAHDVREWAIEHGDDPQFRIALCGFEGEHSMPDSWREFGWKSRWAAKKNVGRERIWFSPHCVAVA